MAVGNNGNAEKKQALFIQEVLLTFKVNHGPTCLSPWTNLLMQTLQAFTGDVGIDLGAGDA
jgi:hypothetical protein